MKTRRCGYLIATWSLAMLVVGCVGTGDPRATTRPADERLAQGPPRARRSLWTTTRPADEHLAQTRPDALWRFYLVVSDTSGSRAPVVYDVTFAESEKALDTALPRHWRDLGGDMELALYDGYWDGPGVPSPEDILKHATGKGPVYRVLAAGDGYFRLMQAGPDRKNELPVVVGDEKKREYFMRQVCDQIRHTTGLLRELH